MILHLHVLLDSVIEGFLGDRRDSSLQDQSFMCFVWDYMALESLLCWQNLLEKVWKKLNQLKVMQIRLVIN